MCIEVITTARMQQMVEFVLFGFEFVNNMNIAMHVHHQCIVMISSYEIQHDIKFFLRRT